MSTHLNTVFLLFPSCSRREGFLVFMTPHMFSRYPSSIFSRIRILSYRNITLFLSYPSVAKWKFRVTKS
jgi:hypothetical protein